MEYTIKKGNHYSDNLFPDLTLKRKMLGSFKFKGDAAYYIEKQKDTNKIIGLSDSYYHRKSSIRLGWRWDSKVEKLQLMYIHYNKGVATRLPIMYIESDVEYEFTISILKNEYVITITSPTETKEVRLERKSKWWFLRYVLYPYFGGTTKAPKEFKIEIEYILF